MQSNIVRAFAIILTIAGISTVVRLTGGSISGSTIAGTVIVVFVLMSFASNRPKKCPRCAELLPALREPTSLRQGFMGGWSCVSCGCEIDRYGRETSKRA